MLKHNQVGAVNSLVVSLVLAVLLLVGALGFGAWAFSSRQDYKNNVAAKVGVAVKAAKQQQAVTDAAQFTEQAKQPFKTYQGPEAYGSLIVNFPKTWSAYISDSGGGSALVDGYFAPGIVPAIGGQGAVFALRVQVLSQSYTQTVQSFASAQQAGQVTVSAYALPKLPNVVGVKATGKLNNQTAVTMIALPLRSNTLEIWTEGSQYLDDFNNNILPNFSFSP